MLRLSEFAGRFVDFLGVYRVAVLVIYMASELNTS